MLWELVCSDVCYAWEIAPVFQRHSADLSVVIAEPLKVGQYHCKTQLDWRKYSAVMFLTQFLLQVGPRRIAPSNGVQVGSLEGTQGYT